MRRDAKQSLNYYAAALVSKLIAGNWWAASAESCTGGLISDTLTNIAGSSACVLGGIVAYDNAIKMALLGVQESTLRQAGAVSAACALEMAAGVRLRFAAAAQTERVIGISATGIAGPGGGSLEKPVGLVYIGISVPAASRAYRYVWQQDRLGNKAASVMQALRLIDHFIEQGELPD